MDDKYPYPSLLGIDWAPDLYYISFDKSAIIYLNQ